MSALTAAFATLATATESALAAVSGRSLKGYYGAKGDGQTNDTAALKAAISDSAKGAALFVPPGIYLSGPLKLPAGLVLTGLNAEWFSRVPSVIPNPAMQSCIRLLPGSTGPLLSPDDATNLANCVRIRDIALDCSGQAQPAINLPDSAVSIPRNWLMERLYISNVGGSAGYGFYVGNQNNACLLRDSMLFNGTAGVQGGHHGIGWYGADGLIDNSYVGQFGGVGVTVLGGASDVVFTMRGGGSFGNQSGIVIGGAGAVIDGVSIDRNFNDGMYVVQGPTVIANSVFTSNSRTTDNQWSNVTVDANGVQLAMTGCRSAPLTPEANGRRVKYMIDTRGHTVTVAEFGNYAAPGVLGTGWKG
jgi:hypothetical protein